MKLLLIEDERPLAKVIARVLSQAGYQVDIALEGEQGESMARSEPFDLIILDVMLPKRNGWQVLENLRAAKIRVPILMLTALEDVEDRVRGLMSGADDYLPKPFENAELLARIHALLRRESVNKSGRLQLDDLVLDTKSNEVTRAGKKLDLTKREFTLLEALMKNQGRVLSRSTIQDRVWGAEECYSNTVDVFIMSLRKKIDKPFGKRLIHTVIGFGYVMRVEDQDS